MVDNTSGRPDDLRILDEAVMWADTRNPDQSADSTSRQARVQDILLYLNDSQWVLVPSKQLNLGPKFTEEELHRIRMQCIDELEDESISDIVTDQDWEALERVAGNLARCKSILDKIGYQ
jgi:hypothetical protein